MKKPDVMIEYRKIPDEVRARLCNLPILGVCVWWASNSMNGDWPCEVWETDRPRVLAAATAMGKAAAR